MDTNFLKEIRNAHFYRQLERYKYEHINTYVDVLEEVKSLPVKRRLKPSSIVLKKKYGKIYNYFMRPFGY